MLKGYTGKILKIYLSNSNIEVKKLDEETLKRYIGGSGLAARIVYDTTLFQTPALSPENPLVFMTGPFTGTKVPTSGRHSIAAKSPLTGIWGESDVGGSWGFSLKNAGYDGIIFTGISERPVYVWIHNDKVELRDASFLWGMDTYKLETILKAETDRDASVACIGPAGESLVKFSAIMHDGKHARAAGRCGLGAVMGSKRLKAVVVKGDRKQQIADEKGLLNAIRDSVPGMVKKTEHLRKYGTSGSVETLEEMGDIPIKNWQERTWQEGASKISGVRMVDTIYSGDYYCNTCVIGCGKEISITEGRYAGVEGAAAEHETVAMLGSLCMVDDLEAISMANQLCNQYGMDTISTGGAVAFAMEAYERGLIGPADTDGIVLSWGNAEAMVEIVRRIGTRTGNIGRLLGEGVRKAAEALGDPALEFAIHVKGMELPAHDPRAFGSLALGYATSNRGACHLQAYSHPLEGWITMPDLGYPECLDPHNDEGKAVMVARLQDLMCMFDSLKLCKFSLFGGISATDLVAYLHCITGCDMDLEEFMKIGDRIFTLKRLYNCRCGIGRKDDILPPRLLERRRGDKGAEDYLPDLGKMLNEYYQYRGWKEDGIPSEEKIREVGLDDV